MNFDHVLPKNTQLVIDRQGFLMELCKGKNVLHLGCVDSGLTKEAIIKGNFLQSKIAKVANMVIGVDSDVNGLEFLEEHKSSNERFLQLNIENLSSNEIKEDIDIIVAGEMLEHLSCPGIFLENIQRLMHNKNARMVLTVPNAFNLIHLFSIWDGKEYVHPDHNYYFSFATIKNFCHKYKLNIDKVYTYYIPLKSIRGKSLISIKYYLRKKIVDYFVHKAPFLAEGLIFIMNVK